MLSCFLSKEVAECPKSCLNPKSMFTLEANQCFSGLLFLISALVSGLTTAKVEQQILVRLNSTCNEFGSHGR